MYHVKDKFEQTSICVVFCASASVLSWFYLAFRWRAAADANAHCYTEICDPGQTRDTWFKYVGAHIKDPHALIIQQFFLVAHINTLHLPHWIWLPPATLFHHKAKKTGRSIPQDLLKRQYDRCKTYKPRDYLAHLMKSRNKSRCGKKKLQCCRL